ncbi:hypothetical protein [Emcibacter sp. SYSU 3D8]|uniref:hypothetical protein n=1 Tax=Emcibacter sp. SYSU 3D8 TaxID=3133969 RepID=UPI0031FE5B4F
MTYYDFVKTHSKLRMSPATAAGVSERLWEIGATVGAKADHELTLKPDHPSGAGQLTISSAEI